MTVPSLLMAMEGVAAVYAFARSDLLGMSIREMRWWVRAAAGRQAEQLTVLSRLLKGR